MFCVKNRYIDSSTVKKLLKKEVGFKKGLEVLSFNFKYKTQENIFFPDCYETYS